MPITFLDEEEDIAPLATPAKRKITFLDEEEDITPLAPPTKRKITFLDEEDDIAPVTPQATQPAVTQPSPYKYDPSRFRPKGVSAPKAEQEIGTLEGIANAARNAFDSSRQALDIVGDVTPEEAKNIAKIEFDKQSRKIAPGYDEYQKAEGFDAVLAFAKNPIEVTSNIVAEGLAGSLPALGAGLAAGGVGAAIGAPTVIGAPIGFTAGQVAGTFAGSLATEYGSKILEEMQEGGVDLTKPESIQGFFENEEAVAKARDKAISRGIPVAAFDAISAGIGGKLGRVIGKQFLTKTGEAAAELGVQAGLGGGGEVAGALVAGEPIEGKAVFGEVIGEAGPGAAEIITGRMADRAARVKAEEEKKIKAAAQLSENLEQNSAPLTAAAVMSTTATTIEQDKLAAQLEEQLDADEIAAQVSEQVTPPITEAIAEAASGVTATKPKVQVTNIDSIINQGGGTVAVQEDGRDVNFKQFGITIDGDTAEVAFVEIDPSEYGKGIGLEAYRSLGNELLSRGITLRSSGAQYGAGRNLWLKLAQKGNARSIGQGRFEFVAQPAAPLTEAVTPTAPVKPSAKPKAKIPPPPPAIITDSTTSEQISSEISTRRSALNAYDFGTEANNKIEAEINKLEAELQSRNEAVTPTITPAVTPAVPTAQPPITDATQEIIQPEGVRQEPQDRVEVRPTEEAGAGDSLLGAERGQEEGQVVPAAPAIPEAITRAIEERRPISAPFVLQYGVDLPRGWRYEDDFFVPPAAPVTPAPVEPAAIVEQEPVAPVTTPPVTEAVTPAAEQPAVSIPASGKPFEFFSIRNKEKAPRLGTQFGQDVEPSGKYISQSTPDAAKNLDARFEKKTVRFENPLVVEFGGEYGTATNWKNVLSSQYGGKTGKQLSQAIRDAGYDGIVTVEPAKGPNRPAYTSEIVDIRSLKPKKQAATPTPAAPEAPVAEPAGISVGSRIKLGKSPQTYTIEEVIPQSATERELGEQYYSVKNERTGETQVVEARDLRQVKGKGARKLFAGERAEIPQFMRDSLNTARAMAAAGKTTEEIRAVTGWFPGRYDGKMRWEIPDNKARFIEREFKTPAPKIIKGTFGKNLNFTQNDDGLYYAEINGKPDWTTGAETREGAENLYYEFNPRKIKYGFGVSGKLFDVIDHGNLFKAYPSAREIAIQFALLPPEKLGAYVRGENKIVISSSLNKNEALSTILHEIQHWVQEQEGFVKGGSPDLFSDSSSYDDFYKNWQNIQDSLTDAYILRGYMDRLGISVADAKSEYRKEFEKEHHPEAGGLAKTLTKEQILEEVNQHGKRLDRARQAAKAGSSFEAYRKVAGEIEARDVQARLELTDEQRSATEPYSSENIALEDAIVIQESEGAASEVSPTPENILITPPDQQYTFNEVFDVAYDMFGGEIPEGFTIVNDSKDKDFEFKAAYIPESGEIIVNLAYLNKSDDIRDTITHELGHYIFGDPEFRAAFDQFIASLSPEARADLDAYVETAYNKYTGEIRLEEKMVRAFVDQFINEEQAPAWRSMLDAIKRFLNKLGFKFNISDRDAISVFTAALDRYKAGEAISREGGARKIIDDLTAMDAEYLAAVERGDMETAQRMVDEAAETAGYSRSNAFDYDTDNYSPWFHGSPEGGITVFKNRFDEYYFSNDRDTANSFGDAVYESYLKMSNPLIADAFGGDKYSVTFEGEKMSVDDFVQIAKTKGHDSAIIENVVDSVGGVTDPSTIVAVFNPTQIKSADPVTYDDAGDVIPLSQRFRPTSPDIRRMAAEPAEATPADEARREEFAGMQVGRIITTPPGIKQKTTDIIRAKFFDSTKVSPESTSQAWAYISQFMDKADNSNNKFAGYVNNATELELPEADRRGIDESIGAVMLQVELANYAGRLAVQGDTKMLAYMIRNGNRMPTGEYAQGVRKAGKDLNAVKDRIKDQAAGFAAFNAELKSNVERLASTLFGTNNPNEDQIAIAQQALTEADNIELGDANQVAADIKEVEGRTKTNLIDKVDAKISQAIDKSGKIKDLEKKATRPRSIESQTESVIESLQRSLGELPPLPQRRESDIRTIVKQDLRQNPDMGRREPWNNMLVGRLIQAGVTAEQAQIIADLTWKQHEQKAINRELKELRKAVEEGSLAVIIDRIKNTPLEKQQSPEWKKDVIMEYLREAGLSTKAAETAAKLYDSVISERLAAAKQKAFEATLAKAAPWKDYASRNSKLAKDALRKVQDAIRTGVLDPDQTTESIIAAQNGWTGFTKEQYQRIVEIDTILNDPKQDDVTKKEALAELNKIITAAKLPAKFKEAIADYYVGQALLGIPTFSVNMASPAGFSIRNILTDIAKYAFTDPKRIPIAFESLLDSMRSWYGNVSYSFRTEIYPNDVVEYLQGGDALKEIFNRGKKQWAEGKYAEGFTNMAVGMAHITKKVLSALDQGAISMIENQNLTRYAMEALSAQKKIPKDQIRAFGQSILAIRNQSIAQSVSEGMPRDRAIVLADLAAKSELIYSLSRYDISPDDVLNSAINDALQSVGRNRKITIKGIEESDKDISDTGTLTYLPIRFLEMIAEKSMQSGPAMQVFSKMVYGFALIPARVFSNVAWFSPVGAYRFAVDAFANKMGWKSPYAMSLGTGLQYRQRLTETIAGSIAMLGLVALRSDSTEDDEDKKFKIVITGNGPNAVTDKQYYDSWMKKWKPYSIHIVVNGTIIPINIGRGGEALFFPIMLAGALDDLAIKKKQNLTKKEPEDLVSAVEVLGSSFFALAQRGPYAAFTKPLFDASKQGRVTEELASQAGYFGKTFIPVLGTSLARNITDFINDPVDRSSIEGAIYANTPVVGPWLGTKALNALGQPIRADDWGDKLFKLGVPVVFSFPKNTPENALNELILKQGGGPTIPTRSNAQKRFGDILTDKEFETYVREYGRVMSDKMFKSRTKLANMKPADYDDELEKYARGYSIDGIKIKGASDSAVLAVKRMRQ